MNRRGFISFAGKAGAVLAVPAFLQTREQWVLKEKTATRKKWLLGDQTYTTEYIGYVQMVDPSKGYISYRTIGDPKAAKKYSSVAAAQRDLDILNPPHIWNQLGWPYSYEIVSLQEVA